MRYFSQGTRSSTKLKPTKENITMSWFERLVIAIVMALVVAGITLMVVQAQTQQPPVTPAFQVSYDTCKNCHADIYDEWKSGPHGQALSDPVFVAAWEEQGEPGACLVCHTTGYDPATGESNTDGVSCQACHSPIPPNHPTDNMPVDDSPDLCVGCHSGSHFGIADWQLSAHYQRNMSCTVCHDQHSAGMKTIKGTDASTKDASDLCANCHKDAMQNFPTSTHAEAGVTCVNCHLGFNINGNETTSAASFDQIHQAPDHSFVATVSTCNQCHSNQMHAPGEAVAAAAIKIEEAGGTATPEPTPAVTPIGPVTNQPVPVSPIGFAAIAGLLGLAGGMVLAPWLDRAYRHYVKEGKDD
jgi:predicted CXXCH cytochrome family protein